MHGVEEQEDPGHHPLQGGTGELVRGFRYARVDAMSGEPVRASTAGASRAPVEGEEDPGEERQEPDHAQRRDGPGEAAVKRPEV